MRWARRARLWAQTVGLPRRAARLQHDQAVEQAGIVDELKQGRRAITHALADEVLKLDAVTDRLEATDEGEEQ